jgi:hypothetical protein
VSLISQRDATTDTDVKSDRSPVNPNTVRSYADFITEILPKPSETFTVGELDAEDAKAVIRRLQEESVVEVDGDAEIETPSGHTKQVNRYHVSKPAHAFATDIVASRDSLLPCGHAGVKNRGGTITCGFDYCDDEWKQSEIG